MRLPLIELHPPRPQGPGENSERWIFCQIKD
jgi:hypothetical protein